MQRSPNLSVLATALTRRPAVPTAVLFILGVLAHHNLPDRPLLWLVAIGCLLAGALTTFSRQVVNCALLALALALSGVALAQNYAHRFPRNHISAFATDEPRLCELELRLDQPPRVLSNAFAAERPLPPRQVVTATVTGVRTWQGWSKCGGEILVSIGEPHPGLAAGQVVRVTGMLQRPGPAMNPGQFDWSKHYREQRVLASLQVPHASNVKIISQRLPPLLTRLREHVRRDLAAGFDADRSLDHALLRALLLGDSDPELRDVQEQFRRTGTSHHLAISGLHVAVLGGLVWWCCRLLCISPRVSAWTMTLFVILYGVVALPSPPVVRSVLLCTAFGLGMIGRRSLDAIQLLALSVLGMLIYRPLDIYNAGFQLSFVTVLGLILFTKPLLEWTRRWRSADTEVLKRFGRQSTLSAALSRARAVAVQTLIAGGVAWAVSLPLIAFHFEQLNPWAIFASILLAPLVFTALVGGMLKVVLTMLWPGMCGLWAGAAAAPVALMRHAVDLLARFPGADVPLAAPPVWMIALYYALLALPLLPCARAGLRWCARCGPAAACAMLPVLPLWLGSAAQSTPRGELRLTVLAVGAGQCVVLEMPDGQVALVDAGSSSLQDPMRKCLNPFLRHSVRRRVTALFLSHSDYDHINAAVEAVQVYDIKAVYTGPAFARYAAESEPARSTLQQLTRLTKKPPTILSAGDHPKLCSGVEVQTLSPDAGTDFNSNDAGLVLRICYAGRSILLPADIEQLAEHALLQNPAVLHADVLIAPHHGSSESTTAAFVSAVDPKIVVSSNDRTLSAKQRHFDSLIGSRPFYRTNRCGAVTVIITATGHVRVQSFLTGAEVPAPMDF